jgi:hypothetical protein
MGGGFRSVPPTGLPEAALEPHQVRHLPTAVVSLNGPGANARPAVPAKGELLQIGEIDRWTGDARTRTALKRLAAAKAPQTIAQMVLWHVAAATDWADVGRLSRGWGNASEIALARRFVDRLETPAAGSPGVEPGVLYWEARADGDRQRELVDGLRALWGKYPVLGLTAREGVPPEPDGPALAFRMELRDVAVELQLGASHPSGSGWVALGGVRIKRPQDDSSREPKPDEAATLTSVQKRERAAARLGDAVAEALVQRLVRVTLTRGARVKGKESFRIKLANESPLILNGLAIGGRDAGAGRTLSAMAGLCVPPRKSLTVPASAEMVERLHLDEGVGVLAVDLSGL